jgi:hypothetical protein
MFGKLFSELRSNRPTTSTMTLLESRERHTSPLEGLPIMSSQRLLASAHVLDAEITEISPLLLGRPKANLEQWHVSAPFLPTFPNTGISNERSQCRARLENQLQRPWFLPTPANLNVSFSRQTA